MAKADMSILRTDRSDRLKAALDAYETAESEWAVAVSEGRPSGMLKRRVDRLAREWAELDSADIRGD